MSGIGNGWAGDNKSPSPGGYPGRRLVQSLGGHAGTGCSALTLRVIIHLENAFGSGQAQLSYAKGTFQANKWIELISGESPRLIPAAA